MSSSELEMLKKAMHEDDNEPIEDDSIELNDIELEEPEAEETKEGVGDHLEKFSAMVRESLAEEHEAAAVYTKRAAKCEKHGMEDAAKLFRDIAQEEVVHAGEFQALMEKYGILDQQSIEQGEREAAEILMEDPEVNSIEEVDEAAEPLRASVIDKFQKYIELGLEDVEVNWKHPDILSDLTRYVQSEDVFFHQLAQHADPSYGDLGENPNFQEPRRRAKALGKEEVLMTPEEDAYFWDLNDARHWTLAKEVAKKILAKRSTQESVNEAEYLDKGDIHTRLLQLLDYTQEDQRSMELLEMFALFLDVDQYQKFYEFVQKELDMSYDEIFKQSTMEESVEEPYVHKVTRDEWNKEHDDHKMIKNGKKYMVYVDPESHKTVLGPVEIVDEELASEDMSDAEADAFIQKQIAADSSKEKYIVNSLLDGEQELGPRTFSERGIRNIYASYLMDQYATAEETPWDEIRDKAWNTPIEEILEFLRAQGDAEYSVKVKESTNEDAETRWEVISEDPREIQIHLDASNYEELAQVIATIYEEKRKPEFNFGFEVVLSTASLGTVDTETGYASDVSTIINECMDAIFNIDSKYDLNILNSYDNIHPDAGMLSVQEALNEEFTAKQHNIVPDGSHRDPVTEYKANSLAELKNIFKNSHELNTIDRIEIFKNGKLIMTGKPEIPDGGKRYSVAYTNEDEAAGTIASIGEAPTVVAGKGVVVAEPTKLCEELRKLQEALKK